MRLQISITPEAHKAIHIQYTIRMDNNNNDNNNKIYVTKQGNGQFHFLCAHFTLFSTSTETFKDFKLNPRYILPSTLQQ